MNEMIKNKRYHVCACIVTYNPDLERLAKNFNAVAPQAEAVLVIDNGSKDQSFQNSLPGAFWILSKENRGVAWALNQAFQWAQERGFQWVLSLDQDSVCSDGFVRHALNVASFNNDQIGIIYPQIEDKLKRTTRSESIPWLQKQWFRFQESILQLPITSGALTSVSAFFSVKGLTENFFIDNVDFELDLKLLKAGYTLIKSPQSVLDHRLGNPHLVKKTALWSFISSGYAPWRYYYVYKNTLRLMKYYFISPIWMSFYILSKIWGIFSLSIQLGWNSSTLRYARLGISDFMHSKERNHTDVLNFMQRR